MGRGELTKSDIGLMSFFCRVLHGSRNNVDHGQGKFGNNYERSYGKLGLGNFIYGIEWGYGNPVGLCCDCDYSSEAACCLACKNNRENVKMKSRRDIGHKTNPPSAGLRCDVFTLTNHEISHLSTPYRL